jgi:hypothetical protein
LRGSHVRKGDVLCVVAGMPRSRETLCGRLRVGKGFLHAGRLGIAARDPCRADWFTIVADPVGAGFVDSLARPGGNVTGFTNFEYAFGGKMAGGAPSDNPSLSRTICDLHHASL